MFVSFVCLSYLTDLKLERSISLTWTLSLVTPVSWMISSLAASALSVSLQASISRAPRLASSVAAALPMPTLAPVTTATFPSSRAGPE